MPKPRDKSREKPRDKAREKAVSPAPTGGTRSFKCEYLNGSQKMAWAAMEQHDIIFLTGPAGTGKTHLATAYAISEVLAKRARKIVLTRPIVEAGESLGYLPGDFNEKVNPYMMPLYDCISKCVGFTGYQFEAIQRACEVAPLAYMRGRTFDDAICIFDESQNATLGHLKLFLTRMGKNSKMIITGDPTQSDLKVDRPALVDVVRKVGCLEGVAVVEFKACAIVRHPLVGKIIEKLATE